jgi:hypothetical protein
MSLYLYIPMSRPNDAYIVTYNDQKGYDKGGQNMQALLGILDLSSMSPRRYNIRQSCSPYGGGMSDLTLLLVNPALLNLNPAWHKGLVNLLRKLHASYTTGSSLGHIYPSPESCLTDSGKHAHTSTIQENVAPAQTYAKLSHSAR